MSTIWTSCLWIPLPEGEFLQVLFLQAVQGAHRKTLYQYLTEYRVNKSKEYLTYSKLSIHAIATEVGFKSTLTYSRSFKKLTDMTPSEFREAF